MAFGAKVNDWFVFARFRVTVVVAVVPPPVADTVIGMVAAARYGTDPMLKPTDVWLVLLGVNEQDTPLGTLGQLKVNAWESVPPFGVTVIVTDAELPAARLTVEELGESVNCTPVTVTTAGVEAVESRLELSPL